MRSTKDWISRVGNGSDAEAETRKKTIRYGHKLKQLNPGTLQGGKHTISFCNVEPAKLEVFLATAYDPVKPSIAATGDQGHSMFHAGVLLKAHHQQIHASFASGAWQYLLVHLAVSRNTVCIRLELSQSLAIAAQDVSNIYGLSEDAKTRFIPCGLAYQRHISAALQVARDEMAKPVFALSREEEDTSCLHFAMRLLHALECMPPWNKIVALMPDAPLKKETIKQSFNKECEAKL